MNRLAENNNELTEAEIKERYDLNDKEKQIMKEAFELGIKETIKDFLDEKYGDTFSSEDDVRARIYHNIIKNLDKLNIDKHKLISSINLETETLEKIKSRPGELDITAMTLSPKKEPKELEFDVTACMEIKYCRTQWHTKNLKEKLNKTREGKIAVNDVINELADKKIKNDFKKLNAVIDDIPDAKVYYILFVIHKYKIEKDEKIEAEIGDIILESLRDGKNITWVYVIRYSDFGKRYPFKSGIVKSNDKSFEQTTA